MSEPTKPLTLLDSPESVTVIDDPTGRVEYYPRFLPKAYADRLFEYLLRHIPWEQRELHLYGRNVPFPRLVAWFNRSGEQYAFSGVALGSSDVPSPLLRMFEAFNRTLALEFNSVLLNYYRHGKDSISWHTDAEPELGDNPTVASISLGATRRFMLRPTNAKRSISVDLEHGSLLIMRDAMMHFWKHQIPKQPEIVEPRINLTFRYMLPNGKG